MNNDKNMTVSAVVRLAASLVVVFATMLGIHLDVEFVAIVLGVVASGASMVYALWWKNAPITNAAKEAQELFYMIKDMDGYTLDPVEFEDDEEYEDGEVE